MTRNIKLNKAKQEELEKSVNDVMVMLDGKRIKLVINVAFSIVATVIETLKEDKDMPAIAEIEAGLRGLTEDLSEWTLKHITTIINDVTKKDDNDATKH